MKSNPLSTALAILLIAGCASTPVVHYAPFGEVDQDESGIIEWYEFKAVYPDASPKSFLEADRDKNGEISPEEWEAYMEDYRPE
ncbi:MAG: hypothetical protein QNJ61_02325 [Desulfobacterales bacterium]|nr:hypothetical protein [Desulfobacterales bacterium]